ncbi:uncharacterized protein VDAG_00430 [Verticillium dahliae VdLs.17]|uniref:Rhodopsin domain-containing protein n=1 Tax=Verticillium dahliae (strain VdLs.17 / ATCC MYA-4575 / FGSC 10137) TaxID=498257 RepID=G2WS97_VERDV|nr:uncharacterized protein VDAG_00430 [Verticillium dahliae VdLs.17]EGY13748.1 hypothetical protein VDAG_00430 [Verticillium dahliae VdLs.17]
MRRTLDMDWDFVPRVHSERFNQCHGLVLQEDFDHSEVVAISISVMSFPVTNGVTTFIPPPDGYEVNFDKPQQQNVVDHYFIFGVLGSVALVCLTQRLYTKQALAGGLQVDDGSISLGGLGHHAWEMSIDVFEKHMLSSYIAAPIFITCNGLSKTSLLTLYLRISPQRWFNIIIWSAIAIVASYTVTIAGLLLFGCKPIRSAWDPYVTGKCVDFPMVYIAIAVANIVSDVVLFVIPIPTIIKLKMPLAQKIGAGIMFGVGSVFVEVNLFIICGSMPTFRKFLKRFAPKLMGSSYGTSRPSRSAKYADGSQTKPHWQQRTGYAQFDSVEMGGLRADNGEQQMGAGSTVVSVRVAAKDLNDRGEMRDDNSEEEILDNKTIVYSRTFQVQYGR